MDYREISNFNKRESNIAEASTLKLDMIYILVVVSFNKVIKALPMRDDASKKVSRNL